MLHTDPLPSFAGSLIKRISFCWLLASALALSACGGGSSGSSGPGSTAAVTISQSAISQQDPSGVSGSRTVTLTYTVTNTQSLPSSANIVSHVTSSGVAVESVSTTITSGSLPTGPLIYSLSVQLWPTQVLGSGTFSGSVQLQVCENTTGTAGCDQEISGAPIAVPVTYTVSGNAIPGAIATLNESSLSLETPSSATTGPGETTFVLSLSLVSPGPYVTFTQPAGGFVSSVSYSALNEQQGNLSITYVAPGSMSPGTYNENLSVNVCIDPQCNYPVSGSPIVLPVTYVVDASAGVNFTTQTAAIAASDIAWSSSQGKIYAAVGQESPTDPEMLAEIDPATGSITRTFTLAGNPGSLVVSDDGSYAYVSFLDTPAVERVVIATFTSDLTINLGSPAATGPIYARALASVPGAPHSIVVSTYANLPNEGGDDVSQGIFVYDDGVARSNSYGGTALAQQGYYITFGADATTLYAMEPNLQNLSTLTLSATGLAQASEVNLGQIAFGYGLQYSDGLLFDQRTRGLNPVTGLVTERFIPQGDDFYEWFTVDSSLNRGYAYYQNNDEPSGSQWTIQTFNLTTMESVETTHSISVQPQNGSGVQIAIPKVIRWGTNGLAVNGPLGIEIISGSFVTQ